MNMYPVSFPHGDKEHVNTSWPSAILEDQNVAQPGSFENFYPGTLSSFIHVVVRFFVLVSAQNTNCLLRSDELANTNI